MNNKNHLFCLETQIIVHGLKVACIAVIACSLLSSCYHYRKKKNPIIVPNDNFLKEYGDIVKSRRDKGGTSPGSVIINSGENGQISIIRSSLSNTTHDETIPFDYDKELAMAKDANKKIDIAYLDKSYGPYINEDDVKFDDIDVPLIGAESKGKKFKGKDYVVVDREDFQKSMDNLTVQRAEKIKLQNRVFEVNKQILEEQARQKEAEKKKLKEQEDAEKGKGVFSNIKDIISGAAEGVADIFK